MPGDPLSLTFDELRVNGLRKDRESLFHDELGLESVARSERDLRRVAGFGPIGRLRGALAASWAARTRIRLVRVSGRSHSRDQFFGPHGTPVDT